MPLLSVVPVQDMYVNANFKEVQLAKVQPGQKVELVCDIYGDKVDLPRRRRWLLAAAPARPLR